MTTSSIYHSSNSLWRLIRRHSFAAFIILACGITWPVMIVDALGSWGLLPFRIAFTGLGVVITLLASYGPTFAALIVTAITSGKTGLRHLLRRLLIWRVGIGWYLVAIFLPAVQFFVVSVVYAWLSGAPPALPALSIGLVASVALQIVVRGLLNGEEIGWRGFALPNLQANQSALTASLSLGVFWAVFHLPIFFTRGGGVFGGQASIPPLGFLVSVLALTIVVTWIFNNTRGSLLIAYLAHGSMNTWTQVFPGIDPANSSAGPIYWLSVGIGVLTAVIVVVVFGPADLRRDRGNSEI